MQKVLFSLLLSGSIFAFSPEGWSADASRFKEVCKDLFFKIEKPLLFHLERDGRMGLLFATVAHGAVFENFPEFVTEAVEASHVIAVAHAQQAGERAMSNTLERDVASGKPFDIEKKLGPGLGSLYRSYMAPYLQANPDYYPYLKPLMALEILLVFFNQRTTVVSDELLLQAQEMAHRLNSLQPPMTREEGEKIAEEMNLTLQVIKRAQRAGAQVIEIIPPNIKAPFPPDPDDLTILTEALGEINRLSAKGVTSKNYLEAGLEDLDQAAEMASKFNKTGAMQSMSFIQAILPQLEQTLNHHQGVLFNLDSGLMGGRNGLLQALKRRGFQVEQMTRREQWLNYRKAAGI